MNAPFKRLSAPLALVLLCLTAGCATITRGTTETFVVEALPADALVTTSLGGSCQASPCAFRNVSREADFTVRIEKPGYQTQVHRISHHLAGGGAAGVAGNAGIPVVGVIGVVVDANTGATQSLTPNPLGVTLQPEQN